MRRVYKEALCVKECARVPTNFDRFFEWRVAVLSFASDVANAHSATNGSCNVTREKESRMVVKREGQLRRKSRVIENFSGANGPSSKAVREAGSAARQGSHASVNVA